MLRSSTPSAVLLTLLVACGESDEPVRSGAQPQTAVDAGESTQGQSSGGDDGSDSMPSPSANGSDGSGNGPLDAALPNPGDDADWPMPTGAEPACWNASLLLATCYLSQDKCKAEAISLAPVVGKAINNSSCESLKMSAGGAGPLAAAFPPGLPCDSPNVANNLSQFDSTPAVSSVCTTGPKIPAPTCEAACDRLKTCGGMGLDAELTEPYGCWNACGLQGTERARFECSAKAADCASVTSCWEDS